MMRSRRATLRVLSLTLVAAMAPATARAITRCEVLARAQAWVDAGVEYSQTAWYTDPTTGVCCYRTDCSGFVSAVWGLPPPGHTTYTFAGGSSDDGVSYEIDPSELEPGDALNNPSSHIMLYVSGDFWSGEVEVYEEYNWGQPAVRRWRSIDTSSYLAIRYVDIEPCCERHCEGAEIVDENCGRGDCAVYGSSCVDDELGVRCVFYACPPIGTAEVCVSDTIVGSCSNGALESQGDCGAYAAICSTAGGQPGHCASAFCVSSPDEVPVERDICFLDGDLYHCDAAGGLFTVGCAESGGRCNVYPTPHCEAGLPCPPTGEAEVCYGDDVVGRCLEGGIVEVLEDCAAAGGRCSDEGGAHCEGVPDPDGDGDVDVDVDGDTDVDIDADADADADGGGWDSGAWHWDYPDDSCSCRAAGAAPPGPGRRVAAIVGL
jgi:hypothetical protein